MSFITWHTRGNTSAQGKARIWLCVHPDELETYLNPISESIYDVNYHDWAVWYDSHPAENYDEDFYKNLDRMELFVVPVTRKLLSEPNRAMDEEVPFAVKHHIPVLPLIQESGLVEQFNEKFKNLQYIDAADANFKEKLKTYLSRVLIEGALVDQVKSNFDQRIFLSYRKKDRRFVSKIMSEIHRRECFRGVAIWFDDFLNPGENFDKQILDVIYTCKAVVLLVTPNILEEGNYVLTCEYDAATRQGKPILPIEAVETDGAEYHEKYPTLPKAVPMEQVDELWSMLETSLGDGRAVGSTPERDYLYGLAYLNGIDVEKNYAYAVDFLERAAREEYTPAIEKLSSMYADGHGVEFSYSSALRWKERVIECYAGTYAARSDEASAVSYIDALRAYATLLVEANLQKEANESHMFRCKVCEEVSGKFPQSLWFKRDLLEAYMAVSQAHIRNDELDLAVAYLQKAREIGTFLDETEGGVFNAYNMASTYAGVGSICEKRGEYDQAKENYHKAIKCAQEIVWGSFSRINDPVLEEKNEAILPRDVEYTIMHLITLCWMSLGDIAVAENKADEAKRYYHDAERSLLGYSIGNAGLMLTDNLVCLYPKLLSLYRAEENRHRSLIYCERGFELCKIAKEDSWYPSLLLKGIGLLIEIEKAYDHYSLIEEKNRVVRLTIELLEYLVTKTNDAEHLRLFCNASGRYASSESSDGKHRLALEYCDRAITMLNSLGYIMPPYMLNDYLYRFYSEASKCLAADGEIRSAIGYSEKALEICDSGAMENVENRLIDVCGELFDLYGEISVRSKALEYLQRACAVCGEALESHGSLQMKRKLSILLEKLAAFYVEAEETELAQKWMMYSASLANEIFQAQKDARSYDDLLHSSLCLMQILSDDEEAAAMWWNTFLLIIKAYAAEFRSLPGADGEMLEEMVNKMTVAETYIPASSPEETVYEVLAVYSQLNDLCARIHAGEAAEKSYTRIADIGERLLLSAEAPANVTVVNRILCHANKLMGQQWEGLGQRDRAVSCYLLAYEYAKVWLEMYPSYDSAEELADVCQRLGGLRVETDVDRAAAYYLEAQSLYKRMIAEYGEIYEKHNYAAISILLGKIYVSEGNMSLALAVYEEALGFLEKDPDMDRMYPRMLAIVLEKTGDVYWGEKDGKWVLYYDRALEIFQKIYDASPGAQSAHDLEIITERVARCHRLSGDAKGAELLYLRLEKIQDLLYKAEPSLENLKKRKETMEILEELYEQRDDVDSCIVYIEKRIKICEIICEHEPTEEAWFWYAMALYKVAILRQDRYWLKQALRILETISEQSPNQAVYIPIIEQIRAQLSDM